jgi:hypothetical protein
MLFQYCLTAIKGALAIRTCGLTLWEIWLTTPNSADFFRTILDLSSSIASESN